MTQVVYTTFSLPDIWRSSLQQDGLAEYVVPWSLMRIWDNLAANLPAAADVDDLGLVGVWGSASPQLKSITSSGTSIAAYARFQWPLPPEYVDAQRVYVRMRARVEVAANVSALLDVVAYESTNEGGISADLVTTAAQSFNLITWANYDFVITPTDLARGNVLDIRIHAAVNDTGATNASIVNIGKVSMLLDIKG